MTQLAALTALAAVLAAVLANIGIWAPRKLWVKVVAVAAAAAFMPVAYGGFSALLGRPKPVALEWADRGLEDATVLAAQMREGEAIFLWLGVEGLAEPLSYVLPWSEQVARQLHEAERTAEEGGTEVHMRQPFELSLDDRQPQFYASPQPSLPPKAEAPETPLWFQNPDSDADQDPS